MEARTVRWPVKLLEEYYPAYTYTEKQTKKTPFQRVLQSKNKVFPQAIALFPWQHLRVGLITSTITTIPYGSCAVEM